jgi:DNA-binding response OmpR family regulator
MARLGGLLRRREWLAKDRAAPSSTASRGARERPSENVFSFRGKMIDFDTLELRAKGRTVRLTLMEADLLRYLIRHAGRAVSRRGVLEDVWDLHEDTDTRAIDNFIVRLRKYIEDEPSQPRHLLTVRGVGYRFIPEPNEVD